MEQWDVYDEQRKKTGLFHTRGTPLPKGQCHIVVNIWTVNFANHILLTKRHPDKPYGLMWECTGGSILAGEDSVHGALRELEEEVGIRAKKEELILIHTTKWKDRFIDTYITRQDVSIDDLKLQKEEVVDAKFVTEEAFMNLWQECKLIPQERLKLYKDKIELYLNAWCPHRTKL